MPHEKDPVGYGQKDPMQWIWLSIAIAVALMIGWQILWATQGQSIKNLSISAAYHLHWIQRPFGVLMSDAYQGAVAHMPQNYEKMIGTDYPDGLASLFMQMALRSVSILLFIPLVGRGAYLIINHQKINFSRQLGTMDVVRAMRERYPRVKPATAVNLTKKDARFGSWASAMNPVEVAAQHRLITLESPETIEDTKAREDLIERLDDLHTAGLESPETYFDGTEQVTFKEYANLRFPTSDPVPEGSRVKTFLDSKDQYVRTLRIDLAATRRYMIATLGPLCQFKHQNMIDIGVLPPAERSLWVIFLACLTQQKSVWDKMEALLNQISDSFKEAPLGTDDHKMNLKGIDSLYYEIKDNTKVKIATNKIARSHAYYYTAFTRLFLMAKDAQGRIRPRDFHWMKVVNRQLYWVIDQATLDTARYEASAVRSHYLAERARNQSRGGQIRAPQIDSALLDFVHRLDKETWTAVPKTDVFSDEEDPNFLRAHWIDGKSKDDVSGAPAKAQ